MRRNSQPFFASDGLGSSRHSGVEIIHKVETLYIIKQDKVLKCSLI